MSIDTDLRAVIGPLLAGGAHNTVNRSPGKQLPYAVFYEITGTPLNTIHGATEATSCTYQVDVFARTPEQAKGLSLGDLKDAIESSSLEGLITLQMAGEYDPISKSYRYITEYQVWDI
ncbi:DUF3168 domain-containing protein [Desulfobulbus rhabdoformis]|jgi:hypothetical protein|uniref:tail completion protein gp17 n=1 Tax=Desulfobulbus rhabdoformis TaxID=34032 RepID=UPI001963EBE9|nr:DUF3168 domain-containing protein [Desulfobulbus rhabdoformis]MBM9615310.1 DUF3168 domain-containing protein [Desulfobulbus rhabdoformis]